MSNLVRREKGYNDNKSLDYYHWYEADNYQPAAITASYNSTKVLNHGRLVGYNTPNFHRRVKAGELLPMTPFRQYSFYGSTSGDYSMSSAQNYNGHGWIEPAGGYIYRDHWKILEEELDALLPDDSNELVQAAAAKIYSSGFDALTFLAEIADIKRLFVQIAKKIIKFGFPRSWKQMSSEWLSYRYGLRPLINDIKSLNQLCKTYGDKMLRRKDRAGRKWSTTDYSTWEENAGSCFLTHQVTDTIEISARASVIADIDVPKIQFNPLVTGWEIIPFSFVIDWFLSIGKALAAVSFLTLSSNYSACYGYDLTLKREYSMEPHNFQGDWTGTYEQYGSCQGKLQIRIPCTVPIRPYPSLNLDAKKIFDLIALIIQRK